MLHRTYTNASQPLWNQWTMDFHFFILVEWVCSLFGYTFVQVLHVFLVFVHFVQCFGFRVCLCSSSCMPFNTIGCNTSLDTMFVCFCFYFIMNVLHFVCRFIKCIQCKRMHGSKWISILNLNPEPINKTTIWPFVRSILSCHKRFVAIYFVLFHFTNYISHSKLNAFWTKIVWVTIWYGNILNWMTFFEFLFSSLNFN